MDPIVIREYQDKDQDACRGLWKELTVWHREIYNDPSIGGSDPGLYFDEHLAKAGKDHFLVAVSGGNVVGLTGYLLSEEEIEVEPLIVTSSQRGRGIGSMLLDALLDRVKGTGVKFLTVRPVMRNVKALEFFRDRGFDKVGRVELFIDCANGSWKKGLRLLDLDFGY